MTPETWSEVAELVESARSHTALRGEPLWLISTDPLGKITTPATRRRLQRMVAASALAARVEHVEITSVCDRCGDPDHGAPVASARGRSLRLSSSSVPGALLVAVAPEPLGLDLVMRGTLTATDVRTARRASAGAWSEVAALGHDREQTWAALEAVGKAMGLGLAVAADEVAASLERVDLCWFDFDGDKIAVVAAGRDVMPQQLVRLRPLRIDPIEIVELEPVIRRSAQRNV